jgi:hypothetical protein
MGMNSIKVNHHAVFIIPAGACKQLGEDGWEFDSPTRIPNQLGDKLAGCLSLSFDEQYSGIKKYIGGDVAMSIFCDDSGEIENIYLQANRESMMIVKEACHSAVLSGEVEIFIPNENA